MDVTLDLGDFGEIGVKGAAAFGMDANNTPFFALYVKTNVQMGVSIMNIKASAILQINTSAMNYVTLPDSSGRTETIAGNTLFDLALDGELKILAFGVDFYGRMSVVDEVFKLEFDGNLNFFNNRRTLFELDVRVFEIVRKLARYFCVLLVGFCSHSLIAFVAVALAKFIRVKPQVVS